MTHLPIAWFGLESAVSDGMGCREDLFPSLLDLRITLQVENFLLTTFKIVQPKFDSILASLIQWQQCVKAQNGVSQVPSAS